MDHDSEVRRHFEQTTFLDWPLSPEFPEVRFRKSSDWRFLGYDVADGGPCSGLSNCAYNAEEMPALLKRFSNRLNSNHLFDVYQDARDFKLLSDQRLPDHAPFYVIALYRIPSPT